MQKVVNLALFVTLVFCCISLFPLDAFGKKGSRFNEKRYMKSVEKKIKSRWKPYSYDRAMKARLAFLIKQDGSITDISVLQTSGKESFDLYAIETLKSSAPFATLEKEQNIEFAFEQKYKKPHPAYNKIRRTINVMDILTTVGKLAI